MAKPPELGDIVEAYCERCRLNLDASIAAVDGDEIRQVQCRTCNNFVRYKKPVAESVRKDRVIKRVLRMRDRKMGRSATAAPDPTPAPPPKPKAVVSERWVELTDDMDSTRATPYVATRVYGEGDYILHKSHGMGYVERLDGEESMVVLFRLGEQALPINQPREYE